MSTELGSIYFWRMIHSCFKQDSSSSESKRALGVIKWVYKHKAGLEDTLSDVEFSFLKPILQSYEAHGAVLSKETFKDTIEEEGGKVWKVLEEMFQEYEDLEPHLSLYSESDIEPCFRGITGLSIQMGMESAWSDTKKILTSDPKITVKGEEKMTKYEKAYAHLRSSLVTLSGKMAHLNNNSNKDLRMVGDAGLVVEQYLQKKTADEDLMSIPMGIPAYDELLRPKRGHFIGILGFAAHRKTTFMRSWAYRAAVQGHRVAHFALEMGADDEFALYHLIHCHNKYGLKGFNKKDFERGNLKEEIEDLFYKSVNSNSLKDDLKGEIFYRQRGSMTWFELAKEIDDLIEEEGVTMVVVDYATLLEVFSKGNAREAKDSMIQSIKPFVESRKILFVSPIQGNREGLNRCVENEGQWDPQGIDTYSSYFRACDAIIGVLSPEETPDQMILSCVKNRNDKYPKPLIVDVCPDTGFITKN